MDLAIVSDEGGAAQLALRGRVTQPQLALKADPLVDLLGSSAYQRKVLLDLSETEFLDSSGVTWLLISHKRFRQQGGRLVLYAAPELVMRVLTVLRMHLVLEICDTLAEAQAKVAT